MTVNVKKYLQNDVFKLVFGALLFSFAFLFDKLGFFYPTLALYLFALLISGGEVFLSAVRGILRGDFLDEKFLMSIASVGAMIIGDMGEGVAVMLFFLLGEIFEKKAVRRSRNSIKSLMGIRPDEAVVILDGEEVALDADDVEIGSVIVIRPGERVPLDSLVIEGSADLDVSMLTGESLPKSVSIADEIESGAIVIGGTLKAKTLKTAENSSAQRILELVENASENKAREESFITVFSRFYTPIVVILAVLLAVFPPIFTDKIEFSESIYRALTFLVISCPCALVISVPMAFFGGIGGAASNGILFKGGNVFSPLSRCDTFVFDKTGTVTTGKPSIERICPYSMEEQEVCYYAASAEYGSLHPISAAIKGIHPSPTVPQKTEEISGKGVFAVVDGKEVLVGNAALFSDFGINIPSDSESGIFVSVGGVYVGSIILGDEVKSEAGKSLDTLRKNGAKRLIMLSGDKTERVTEVAESLGIDTAYGDLLPKDKYEKICSIIAASTKTAFIGDGINDSPSLAVADVGIAMGAIGSDSAIEAADVVIMNDDLGKISLAKRIAKKTLRIAKENIVFAIGVKLFVLILGALGYADMWLAVFADVGVALIAILNSMRAMRVKK